MSAGHGQLLGLCLEAGKTTLIQLGQVTRGMAQRRAGIGGGRQDDLGIAQVEQALLARALEHVLGQRQVAPPSPADGWQRCHQTAPKPRHTPWRR
ncbi:hypothetical protein D3C79_695890 [compost metagenome]